MDRPGGTVRVIRKAWSALGRPLNVGHFGGGDRTVTKA
jgi:hypothetical protein